MFRHDKKVLVKGEVGFIRSHLVQEPLKTNADVKPYIIAALIRQKNISRMFDNNQKIKDEIEGELISSIEDSLNENLNFYRKLKE